METPDMTNYNKSSKEKESSSSGKTNKDSESDLVKSTISEETYVQQQQQEKNARSVEQTIAEQILNEGNKEEMVVDEGRINDSSENGSFDEEQTSIYKDYDNVNGNDGSVTKYFEDKISLPFNTPRNEDDYENIFNQIKRRIESLFKQLFHANFEERIENIRLDLHKDFELFKLTIKELFKDSKKDEKLSEEKESTDNNNNNNNNSRLIRKHEKKISEKVDNEINAIKDDVENMKNEIQKLSDKNEILDLENVVHDYNNKFQETVENILNKITKLDYDFEYLGEEVKSKENKFDKRIHKLERYIVDVGSKLIKEKQTEDVRELIQILKELTTNFNEKSTKIITENVFVKHLKDEISTLKEKCHKKEVAVEELKTLKFENEGEIRELIEEKCNYEKRFYLSEDERNRLMRMVKEFESKLREVENNNHIQYYKYVDEIKKLKESLRELDRCKVLASRRANILLVIMMIFIVVGAYFASDSLNKLKTYLEPFSQ
nr:1371_t:CDS:2 [Entrophospora candida]